MRIGDGRHRAMDDGEPREFRRRQQRAFDVDMGIDEARQDEPPVAHALIALDVDDASVAPGHRAGATGSGVQIHHLTANSSAVHPFIFGGAREEANPLLPLRLPSP